MDLTGFKPNPDYWGAWLWRNLMGQKMIALTQVGPEFCIESHEFCSKNDEFRISNEIMMDLTQVMPYEGDFR